MNYYYYYIVILLVHVHIVEYALGDLEDLVDIVDARRVALDGQVEHGRVKRHYVLQWHVRTTLLDIVVF